MKTVWYLFLICYLFEQSFDPPKSKQKITFILVFRIWLRNNLWSKILGQISMLAECPDLHQTRQGPRYQVGWGTWLHQTCPVPFLPPGNSSWPNVELEAAGLQIRTWHGFFSGECHTTKTTLWLGLANLRLTEKQQKSSVQLYDKSSMEHSPKVKLRFVSKQEESF